MLTDTCPICGERGLEGGDYLTISGGRNRAAITRDTLRILTHLYEEHGVIDWEPTHVEEGSPFWFCVCGERHSPNVSTHAMTDDEAMEHLTREHLAECVMLVNAGYTALYGKVR